MDTRQEHQVERVLTTPSVKKDGSKSYVELSFALVRDEGGAIPGALATGRDCTERYLAEIALRARISELEQVLKSRDRDTAAARAREYASAEDRERQEADDAMRNHERIRKYLKEHLVHASHFPGILNVMVEVKDGNVTLSGTVPHRVMKQSIEDTAAACPGVRYVENNLNVPLTAPWPDSQVVSGT